MGKHSAAPARSASTTRPSRAGLGRVAAATRPLGLVVATAIVVAILALGWSGVGWGTAVAVGFGLLAVAVVAGLVLGATGLLEQAAGEPGAHDRSQP